VTQANPADYGPISLIVPVYNEVENIDDLHREVVAAFEGTGIEYEVILVNDGSTDGSTQALDQLHAEDARFKVVHFIHNYGQTAAMAAVCP